MRFLHIVVKTGDAAEADEERHVALATTEKDYPCILLTLVIIYLLHIIFARLWLSPGRLWLCCEAIALVHRRGIYCAALLEIQMYYHEDAVSGWRYGGRTCIALKPTAAPSRAAPRPPGISLYGGYNCCCKFCRSPTPLS